MLKLPHRQFVFTVPKALRVFFRNNRKLFADISRLIFSIIKEFYKEATGKDIQTGMIIAHQTFRRHAPEGWKAAQQCLPLDGGVPDESECDISNKAVRKAWARFLAKIYEIDPFFCPSCGSEMRVIAIIQDVAEIIKILIHLRKVGRTTPEVDYSRLID